jgi:hypothetical protein
VSESALPRNRNAIARANPVSGGGGEMAGKSLEQRIADTAERIRRLQARKQALAQQAKG